MPSSLASTLVVRTICNHYILVVCGPCRGGSSVSIGWSCSVVNNSLCQVYGFWSAWNAVWPAIPHTQSAGTDWGFSLPEKSAQVWRWLCLFKHCPWGHEDIVVDKTRHFVEWGLLKLVVHLQCFDMHMTGGIADLVCRLAWLRRSRILNPRALPIHPCDEVWDLLDQKTQTWRMPQIMWWTTHKKTHVHPRNTVQGMTNCMVGLETPPQILLGTQPRILANAQMQHRQQRYQPTCASLSNTWKWATCHYVWYWHSCMLVMMVFRWSPLHAYFCLNWCWWWLPQCSWACGWCEHWVFYVNMFAPV